MVLWQLVWGLEHVGGEPPNALLDEASSNDGYERMNLENVRRDGKKEDMMLGIEE